MISVTIYYIWLKCYLSLSKIVADGMRSYNQLAIALNGTYLFFKKKYKKLF